MSGGFHKNFQFTLKYKNPSSHQCGSRNCNTPSVSISGTAENSAAEFNSQKNNIHLYSPLASGGINVILGGQSGFGTETPVSTKSPVTKSPSLGCLQLQPKKRTRLIQVFAHCPVAGFAARRIIHGRTSKSNLGRVRFLLTPAYKQNSDDRSSLHL